MKISAIIVAAGQASRYGKDKLALSLGKGTVLDTTVEAFLCHKRIQQVIVVVAQQQVKEAKARYQACTVVAGGKTRAQSVQNGLAQVKYHHVLVHDGARPNVSTALIDRVAKALANYPAVVPVVPICDSLVRDEVYCARDQYGAVQTPQGFETKLLIHCMATAEKEYPDEGSLVADYVPVHFVEGDVANRKLTYPVDMTGLAGEVCYGIGYDIHRLVDNRPLVLGGVPIDYPKGLEGHSDADCVLHAIMDAMLSSISAGDIGHLFSPQDERWKGADSADLLRIVMEILNKKGAYVCHVSISIIAEQPHLAPYVEAIQQRIGQLLTIPKQQIGITVTTNETVPLALPFAPPTVDAIAAMAVVTIRKLV